MKNNRVMTLKNVSTYGLGATVSGALLTTNANAALDIAGELEKTDAKSNIETGIIWALGIVILIYGGRKVLGFFGR